VFLDEEERLIVVDQKVSPISQEGKRLMREAGVKTVLAEAVVSWHNIEPERGSYYWDDLDRYVNETREAGLKMLLATYCIPPSWVPGAYSLGAEEPNWHVPEVWLNPLNQEGAALELDFIHRLMERYAAPDTCCYYSMPATGERLMPPTLGCTRGQAVEIVLRRQEVFAQYTLDLWTSFHPAAKQARVGNEHIYAVYSALEFSFPQHEQHRLLWTYFTSADCQWQLDWRYWVGAEYAKNVVANAARLDKWGARGLIMSPKNWKDGPVTVDEEVISATRAALEILS